MDTNTIYQKIGELSSEISALKENLNKLEVAVKEAEESQKNLEKQIIISSTRLGTLFIVASSLAAIVGFIISNIDKIKGIIG